MTRSPELAKAAETAAAHFNGVGGFPNEGKINLYICDGEPARPSLPGLPAKAAEPGCGAFMVTVDREPGVTPFMTSCPACKASATSNMYRVPQHWPADHEWYRPDQLDADMTPWTVEHLLKGGLILRKIEPAPDAAWIAFRNQVIRDGLAARARQRDQMDKRP